MDTKYDQQQFDKDAQTKWEKEQTYTCKKDSGRELFSIDTPPPTVSGSLHIGHVFSYTQTDIIARFKRLCGFDVFYPFGFDNNGLATERFVEKKHNVSGYRMGRSDFINLCMSESAQSQKDFEHLWKRLGISADWSNTYSTISREARNISQRSFVELYNKGFVYQKEEPALYCTTCFTSVAQAELDDIEFPSHFNDITFTAEDGSSLVVATTRPELLPSCVALFYHPDDERYKHLEGKTAKTPVFGYKVPIYTDEAVSKDKGSGLVMCCTFGDKNDIAWFKKYNLPYRQSIGFDGRWNETTGKLQGLKENEARKKILELLQEEGSLKNQKAITHPVNVHERCQKPIEYVVLKQWFLNILDYKKEFLKAADELEWYPSFMKARYRDWVEHLGWDWCLSRQRFYGIPFPVWYCNSCNKTIVAETKDLPLDPQEKDFPGKACPQCDSTDLRPETDVMDTWNTSSLTPYIVFSLYKGGVENPFDQTAAQTFLPMAMRPQAHDIIRTWAFYTIIKAWMHNKTLPWKSIVISGHVLSNERDKISKSKGNNPFSPENLLSSYPADAIRYWTASGTLGHDVAFSEGQLKIGMRLITKLWNAFRFLKEHISETPHEKPTKVGELNEWLLHRVHKTFLKYKEQLEKNEFGHALSIIEKFFWNDFCDNYLELVKDQLFNGASYNPEQIVATRWTLFHVGLRILQMFAPYLPHVTETIYESIFAQSVHCKSLHITEFKAAQTAFVFESSEQIIQKLIDIIAAIRRFKTEKQLSLKVPLSSLTLHSVHQDLLKKLVPHEQLIKGVTHAQAITYASGDIEKSTLEKQDDMWFAVLDLDHIVEAQEESAS